MCPDRGGTACWTPYITSWVWWDGWTPYITFMCPERGGTAAPAGHPTITSSNGSHSLHDQTGFSAAYWLVTADLACAVVRAGDVEKCRAGFCLAARLDCTLFEALGWDGDVDKLRRQCFNAVLSAALPCNLIILNDISQIMHYFVYNLSNVFSPQSTQKTLSVTSCVHSMHSWYL